MSFLFLVLAISGALAALPIWLEQRRTLVDAKYRETAPGLFAKLSDGLTHYRWHGPVRGPVLVAIHGLTTPSSVWNNLALAYGTIGYRVLTYDLYGRGYSDAPKGRQDAAFFRDQLDELLQEQGVKGDISLLGYSMGGSIAVSFAAQNTHRVTRLFLVATAGIETTESDFSRFCRERPYLGDWRFEAFGPHRMTKAIKADRSTFQVEGLKQDQLDQPKRQGFVRSVLASRRGLLSDTLEQEHREIAKRNIPVHAIWGEADPVIPLSSIGILSEWNREAQQEVIPNADHGLPYTHQDEVWDAFEKMMALKV